MLLTNKAVSVSFALEIFPTKYFPRHGPVWQPGEAGNGPCPFWVACANLQFLLSVLRLSVITESLSSREARVCCLV